MIAFQPPITLADSSAESSKPLSRADLRWRSVCWALLAGLSAGLISLPFGVEQAVRSTGCGLFYGLLAFHLERVDPEDSHLQAGLVGAICGVRSLGMPLPLDNWQVDGLASLLLELLQAWLPLIGSALLLHGTLRFLPASRP